MMVPRFCPASGPASVSPADAIANSAAIINNADFIFIFVRSVGRCFNWKFPDQNGCDCDRLSVRQKRQDEPSCAPFSAMYSRYFWFSQKFLNHRAAQPLGRVGLSPVGTGSDDSGE